MFAVSNRKLEPVRFGGLDQAFLCWDFWQSVGATGTECVDVVRWDVTAAKIRSSLSSLKESGEMTSAGRRFVEVRSVNGNETRTISPRL
jgi:hypothetical protein